jgi:hypothetical protein
MRSSYIPSPKEGTMNFLIWFAVWFVAMSFVEHFAHRHLMHRKGFIDRWFPMIYHRHAIQHHRTYYKVFNPEPDDFGRKLNIRFEILPSLPIALVWAALLFPFSKVSASMVLAAIFAHHALWNLVHEEMHDPKGRFFSKWGIYRFLARYHWMHHTYPGKNYNVVLPLADYVWGTHLKPSQKDVKRMEEIGL